MRFAKLLAAGFLTLGIFAAVGVVSFPEMASALPSTITYYVNSASDNAASIATCENPGNTSCGIDDAIAAFNGDGVATDIDQILFSSSVSTFTVTSPTAITNTTGATLTITGNGAANTAVSGNDAVRVFAIDSGTVTISDLTIENGLATNGGGVWNEGTLDLADDVIANNTASAANGGTAAGGGIYCDGGALALDGDTITDNEAAVIGVSGVAEGGGIYVGNIDVATHSDVITDNEAVIYDADAGGGGAIYNAADTGSVFGGGIYFDNGNLSSSSDTIDGNTAVIDDTSGSAQGGGIFLDAGTLTLFSDDISNDVADIADGDYSSAQGGGVLDAGGGVFDSSYTEFSDDHAEVQVGDSSSAQGGGIVSVNETFNSKDDTISGNEADIAKGDKGAAQGGGVLCTGIFNSKDDTITSNTADIADGDNAGAQGGGVVSTGTFNSLSDTVSGNTADIAEGDNGAAQGGGVLSTGPFNSKDDTITSNTADIADGDNGAAQGGGVVSTGAYISNNDSITYDTAEVDGNSGFAEGGGVSDFNGTFSSNSDTLSFDKVSADGTSAVALGGAIESNTSYTAQGDTLSDDEAEVIGTGNTALGGGLYSTDSYVAQGETITNNEVIVGLDGVGDGGGIYNADGATASITASTIASNKASNADPQVSSGGGVFNAGSLVITSSTLASNLATNEGGAIYNSSNASLNLTNDTVYNNQAVAGGGLSNEGGTAQLTNDTLSTNIAASQGGGILVEGMTTVSNSILYDSTCFEVPIDGGYNVESDNSCRFGSTDVKMSSSIGLANSLAANGSSGPETLAIGIGSSALQEVPSAECTITTDERGDPRPGATGPNCDAGAFEAQLTLIEAQNETNSIDVAEGGTPIATLSATTATGNLLSTAQNSTVDPATLTAVSDAKNGSVTAVSNGEIVIDGSYGTLTANTTSGDYTYSLDAGVVPPCTGPDASDQFTYTLTDAEPYSSSAQLTIDLSCTEIALAQAGNGSGSIDVSEGGYPLSVQTATSDAGNLLTYVQNELQDPVSIAVISNSTRGRGSGHGGVIDIDGSYGTLIVSTTSGDYTYSLDGDVVPPCGNDTDTFTYETFDSYGNTSSATFDEDLDVSCPTVQAENVADSIDVTEIGAPPEVVSSSTASGNLLVGAENIMSDPSSVTSISIGSSVAVASAGGVITIDGTYGTLITYTESANGHEAGDYTYSLNSGVVPACTSDDSDVFTFSLTDVNDNSSSAQLTIDLSCTQIAPSQAEDDSGSIQVTERASPPAVIATTSDAGNLLTNDPNVGSDPSSITSISNASSVAVAPVNGVITVDGTYGTLITYTESANGHEAGDYTYSLNSGVVPACTSDDSDVFTYTITDDYGITSSATLDESLEVSCAAAPTITSTSTAKAIGAYGAGVLIPITVTFSEPVNVTGTPQLALNSGGTASYASGSATSSLTFSYTVAASQNADPLDYASATALTLNGGSIEDVYGNNANLDLPTTSGLDDLLYAASLRIDTTAPVVSITRVNGVTVSFPYSTSQNISSIGGTCGSLTGDLPTVNLTVNSAATAPTSTSCSGGTWTLTLTTPMSSSTSYVFVASQSDTAGNVGQSSPETVALGAKSEGTSVSLTLSKGIITYGAEANETFNGVVTGQAGDGAAEGTVVVASGAVTLCSASLVTSAGDTSSYRCSPTSPTGLPVGTYAAVKATFVPATVSSTDTSYSYLASASTVATSDRVIVIKDGTGIYVKVTPTTITYGHESAALFNVSVSPDNGEVVPNGERVVVDVGPANCVVTLVGGKGTCSIAPTAVPAGAYPVLAVYPGDVNLNGSESFGPLFLLVVRDSTSTAVTESPTTITYGHESAALFNVSVRTKNGEMVPNGERVVVDVGRSNCVVTLVAGAGTCSIANNALGNGVFAISAIYGGDGNLSGSSASSVTPLTVNGAGKV